MATGGDGLHLIAAPQDVVVEHRQELGFATIRHPLMVEKLVQELQLKAKNATLTSALVYFAKYNYYY